MPDAEKPRDSEQKEKGLRETRREDIRERIILAATHLISGHGYDAVSITQIAAAADISRRTFFRYFKGKGDVMISWIDEYGEFLLEELDRRASTTSVASNLSKAVLALAHHFDLNQVRMREVSRIYFGDPKLVERLCAEVIRWEALWVKRLQRSYGSRNSNTLRYEIMVSIQFAAFFVAVRTWTADNSQSTLFSLTSRLLKIIKAGWHDD